MVIYVKQYVYSVCFVLSFFTIGAITNKKYTSERRKSDRDVVQVVVETNRYPRKVRTYWKTSKYLLLASIQVTKRNLSYIHITYYLVKKQFIFTS